MEFLTRPLFEAAIAAQGQRFSSQSIIDHFYRFEQVAYVEELYKHRLAGTYPFTEVHRQIGRYLHTFDNLTLDPQRDAADPTAHWRKP
ncbi:MAG: hypothetical protein KA201_03875 [Kofleriaceae bacterium]|nr:hypothetical protein [Kofleriaceae bacterium]